MTVYAHINSVPHGSTGRIMMKEHHELLDAGHKSFAFWGRGRAAETLNEMKFCTDVEVRLDALQTRFDGKAGFHSHAATKRLLKRLDEIKPDVVHLHNLHGYYLNIEMLFEWLLVNECNVEWTLHDCWAFTGHCAYFTYANCSQWKSQCASLAQCPQLETYPKTISKKSCSWNYVQKRRLFNLLPDDRMKLISPSQWLADLVAGSFLSKYPVEVRHNSINVDVFKPSPSKIRERCGIGDRFMILGVASPWNDRKGLDDFIKLSIDLDSSSYAVVLVGLSSKQISSMPAGLIGLPKTSSPEELAHMYSAANVFFNPTREDNYPTTLLESQACGTPVVTYDVGGCAEALSLSNSAAVSTYEEALQLFIEMHHSFMW